MSEDNDGKLDGTKISVNANNPVTKEIIELLESRIPGFTYDVPEPSRINFVSHAKWQDDRYQKLLNSYNDNMALINKKLEAYNTMMSILSYNINILMQNDDTMIHNIVSLNTKVGEVDINLGIVYNSLQKKGDIQPN